MRARSARKPVPAAKLRMRAVGSGHPTGQGQAVAARAAGERDASCAERQVPPDGAAAVRPRRVLSPSGSGPIAVRRARAPSSGRFQMQREIAVRRPLHLSAQGRRSRPAPPAHTIRATGTRRRARRGSELPFLSSFSPSGSLCEVVDSSSASGSTPERICTPRQCSVGGSSAVLSLGVVGFSVDIAILQSLDLRVQLGFSHPLHM